MLELNYIKKEIIIDLQYFIKMKLKLKEDILHTIFMDYDHGHYSIILNYKVDGVENYVVLPLCTNNLKYLTK